MNYYLFISSVLVLLHMQMGYGVSFVYNLRLAEVTKRSTPVKGFLKPMVVAATAVNQWRTTYGHIKQQNNGGLFTWLYTKNDVYFRADTAVAKVQERLFDSTFSRTQSDDILFTAGYVKKLSKKARVTMSGLFGLPTHKNLGLQGTQFGTGHVGMGAQFDASYVYIPGSNYTIMTAARFIHFFPRMVKFSFNEDAFRFKAHIGNLVDFFVAHYSRWGRHIWEFGYNPSFAFGAYARSENNFINVLASRARFIRSNLYTSYKIIFLIGKVPSGIIVGFSYGLDHTKQLNNLKNSYTTWLTWGINF